MNQHRDHSDEAPAIELKHVTKYYDDTPVLKDISFTVQRGETKIILGGSGSGKSTILKLIIGLVQADEGEIWVEGRNITRYGERPLMEVRKRIGMVFQEGALFDSLSVAENVGFRLYEQGEMEEDKVLDVVRKTLGFVDLEDAIDKMPSELSGGMRRRAAIARALVGTPNIMLYDEPTAGLDPITARTINELVLKLRDLEDVSSIFVTHRLNDAYALANERFIQENGRWIVRRELTDPSRINTHFIMLKDGGIIFQGTEKALRHSGDPYIKRFLI
jgi:phospholipid/cholesterol/gamma-HCH transport system ATP-binding protein